MKHLVYEWRFSPLSYSLTSKYSRSLHSVEKYPKNIPHYSNLYKNSNNFPPNSNTIQIFTTHCARTWTFKKTTQIPPCAKPHSARTHCSDKINSKLITYPFYCQVYISNQPVPCCYCPEIRLEKALW